MEPNEFRHWRKSLGWKQKDAAERLGLKKRVIQYYEKGDRDGKAVAIPTSVELACLALALGHESWNGDLAARAIESRASSSSTDGESLVEAVAALDNGPSESSSSAEAESVSEPVDTAEQAGEAGVARENAPPSND